MNKQLKKKKLIQDKKGSFIDESLAEIEKNIKDEKEKLRVIKRDLKLEKNRLSIVFVTFKSKLEKEQVYSDMDRSLIMRLFFKCCTICSDTSIRGQSFTVKPAD